MGGGEAIDLAIKLARGSTGRQRRHLGLRRVPRPHRPRPGRRRRAVPRPLRPARPRLHARSPSATSMRWRAAVDDETAAVIFETIPATLGMPLPPEDYLRGGARRSATERGARDDHRRGADRPGPLRRRLGLSTPTASCRTSWSPPRGLSGGLYPITATALPRAPQRLPARQPLHPHLHLRRRGDRLRGRPGGAGHPGRGRASSSTCALWPVLSGRASAGCSTGIRDVLIEARQRGLMMGLKMARPACGPLMTVAGFRQRRARYLRQ